MNYVACDWLVWPGADYDLMMRMAQQLGCRLVQIEVRMDETGCIYYVLALNVPDENTLAAYIEHAGQQLGMTEWYAIPEDYYHQGELFLDLDGLQAEAPEILARVIARLDADGEHNRQHCAG
ncbi:MAG TPA: hypothetical protein VKY59_09370 [Spirillospora sp.]|nr:hypothetical protein [Spirillospora sp.]